MLSVLMLARIREILIISTPPICRSFSACLVTFAIRVRFDYAMQPSPEPSCPSFRNCFRFSDDSLSAFILGDNLFYGEDFRKHLHVANDRRDGATIFGYHVADPSAYGVVEFRSDRRVLSLGEKPSISTIIAWLNLRAA